MAIIDIERDVIVIRIVYDGPPFSGKTTSVHALAKILDKRDTVFSPQEDPLSKTLYFDWMEYCGGFFKGYSISCQIISVPGQLSLMERRHFLLRTADSVVFVLDASEANTEIALTYFNDLQQLLSPEDHHFVQVIIQANKQDKPKALSASQLKQTLFSLYPNLKIVDSAAISGKGIRETFVLAVRLALERAEALMVKGQLDHGHPEIDSGEDLFTQLQKDLFFQTIPLKSEATTPVESNLSVESTELVATNTVLQSNKNIITEESIPEIDIACDTKTLEDPAPEPTVWFEQLDNNQENFITEDDSITAVESAELIVESTEMTTTQLPVSVDIYINNLPLESVDSFEPLIEFETTEDEWNDELVEPLLGTEAFTEEEEKFFNQLIASSQVNEEELEEDLEEPFYPLESANATFITAEPLTEDSIISFNNLAESESTAMAGLATEVSETSPPSIFSEPKAFEDLAEDDSPLVLSNATHEQFASTPAAESPSLPEPPFVKDWIELDDSKPVELPEPLPVEPMIMESVVSEAVAEPLILIPSAIEPPLVKDWMELDDSEPVELLKPPPTELMTAVEEVEEPESQESLKNLAEPDHSEVIHLPIVTKEEREILPETILSSPKVSLPLLPNETLSYQWIWPPIAGQTWVKTLFHQPIRTVQESNGIWIIEAADNWLGFSKTEWLYSDIKLAKQTLHDHIRMYLQCSPLLSEQRAIVIATDEKSWRLWQLVQLETTLMAHLLMALQEKTLDKLALEVFRCVSHYAEVYLRCAQYPSYLDLNLETIGHNQERQLIYLGIVDFISPVNERTQMGLIESIKQLLTEPLEQAKVHLEVTAIIHELEKIDGFGQQYLLETLIQLFRQ